MTQINKLKTKLDSTRKQLEDLDISSTYFDNIKNYNSENKNKNLQAIQEKIEGLRNRIYYAKQAADTVRKYKESL
ncbi:hypothetical protein NQ314_017786 [Rhamnusium bicolor]|uniref:Uncharacterized protein n=1 Tax=Rhamnusium bicolor TaxID=1586634 RepID=A0AAV8WSI1_9CUCU|nr:hypothetical protein NQ314_017786 [Rhamnusium bicolor]